ncbi:hypothetical protein CRYUN_Cryun14cG0052300 [Craigia yunnanensis]
MHNVTCFNVFILHIGRIKRDDQTCSPLVNCRSSVLRVSAAARSTSAMLSAGGFAMPILSRDLQYLFFDSSMHRCPKWITLPIDMDSLRPPILQRETTLISNNTYKELLKRTLEWLCLWVWIFSMFFIFYDQIAVFLEQNGF